jgi:hypothetical protein
VSFVNLRCISVAAARPWRRAVASLFAFWPFDFGRPAAARKATASADASGQGLADFFPGPLPYGSLEELRARTIALSRRLPAGVSSARRQTKTGGPHPQPEKVIMTGTLEHPDPTTLVIGLPKARGAVMSSWPTRCDAAGIRRAGGAIPSRHLLQRPTEIEMDIRVEELSHRSVDSSTRRNHLMCADIHQVCRNRPLQECGASKNCGYPQIGVAGCHIRHLELNHEPIF